MEPANRIIESPTLALAQWIAGLEYADLPERTRTLVRHALFDTVGCGVYGFKTPWTRMLLEWAQAGGGKGRARAWGAGGPGCAQPMPRS
jgi:2-methylcitrate dehydratase PrpD